MSSASWFRTMLHQEPIIMWSCMIGAVGKSYSLEGRRRPLRVSWLLQAPSTSLKVLLTVGIAIPVVVPPIRESFSKRATVNPPPVRKVYPHH